MEHSSQYDIFQDESQERQETFTLNVYDTLPCHLLECHGDAPVDNARDFSDAGLLMTGGLQLLFCNSAIHADIFNKETYAVIFDNSMDHSTAIIARQILFQRARKYFVRMQSEALSIDSGNVRAISEKCDYLKTRKQLCTFFSYVRSLLLSIPASNKYNWMNAEIVPQLKALIKDWRYVIKGLTSIPNYVVSNCPSQIGNDCTLATHHLFHCHIEMRWYHMTTLLAVSRLEGPGQADSRQDLEKDVSRCLAELLCLAEGTFAASTLNGSDKLLKLSPFPCTCVRELWFMIQLLSDKLYAKKEISISFWSFLDQLLKPYLADSKKSKPGDPKNCSQLAWPPFGKDVSVHRPSFSLWIFFHLTKLYGYSENGGFTNYLRTAPISDASTLLQDILRCFLASTEGSEDKEANLREVMHLLLSLPTWWPAGIAPLLLLLERFVNTINSLFALRTESASNMALLSKSASEFALQVKQNLRPIENPGEGDNSFTMFLHFLGQQLEAASVNPEGSEQMWRQLRGRIYPRFPATRIQTLTEVGLHNLASLMLTFALAVDMNEVGERLQQMLTCVPKMRESGKRVVLWRIHLTVLLLRAEKSLNISVAAEPLVVLLNEASSKLTLFVNTETGLIKLFIETLQDIAEATTSQYIGIHVLIGVWITRFLEVCSTPDACRALDAVQALASRVGPYSPNQPINTGEAELYAALHNHILPYLLLQREVPNCPAQKIADLAVSMALASKDEDFIEIINSFIFTENVNVRISTRFLTQVLPNEVAMTRVKAKLPNYHNNVIQAWVRCCLLGSENRIELGQLTGVVAKMPQLEALCGGSTDMLLNDEEPLNVLAQLLASRWKSLMVLREKQQLKEQTIACLGRIDVVAKAALKIGKLSLTAVTRLYRVIGTLVQNCSMLLYTQNNSNCLMKGIISQLLLPMSIYSSDTKLMPDIEAALKQTLPLFLRGIANLNPKFDGFVARTIRDIVTQYIPRLAPTRHGDIHPMMECFEDDSGMSASILDAMKTVFFSKRSRILTPGSTQALQLLESLLLHHYDNAKLVREIVDILLESLFKQMLYLEDNSEGKNQVADTIKELLNCAAFRDTPDMQTLFNSKISKLYADLNFHSQPVFRILTWLATMRRSLLLPTIPELRAEVAKVETIRGSGRDALLRNSLDRVESLLGVATA